MKLQVCAVLFLFFLSSCATHKTLPKAPQRSKEERLKTLAKDLRKDSINCESKMEQEFNGINIDWKLAKVQGISTPLRAQDAMQFFLKYSSAPTHLTFVYRDFLIEDYLLVSSKEFLQNHLWVMCIESPRYEALAALVQSSEKSYFDEARKSQLARRAFTWAKTPSLTSTSLLLKLGAVIHLVNAELVTAPSKALAAIENERKDILNHNEAFSSKLKSFNKAGKLPSNFDVPEAELRPYADLYYEELKYTFKKELELEKLYRAVLLK